MKHNAFNFPLAIIGAQWGDEGKGKIVDFLAKEADYVIRFNGGNNAGHTIVYKKERFKLSLLPSGILWQKKLILAQGVVIDPPVLISEIAFFEKRGLKVDLMIDPRVNIVMPYHKELDRATEIWKGKKATGSLHLGIGYCYEDRNNRFGIRLEDLINKKILKEKIDCLFPLKKRQIEKVFGQKTKLTAKKIYEGYKNYGEKLKKYIFDVPKIIKAEIKKKKLLFEGAHGTFLDSVFGTYPYTTAVSTISGSIFSYVGLAPQKIYTLGVIKAYTTRVGNGPFPTELFNKIGEKIRQVGDEYGTVSKRPRRCGWLDLVMIRTADNLSGFDYLAITKLDVLSFLSKIKIATHYLIGDQKISTLPLFLSDLAKCQPVYREFLGWQKSIFFIRRFPDLPVRVKTYLDFIEKNLKVPIKIISIGAERNKIILRD